MKEYKLFPLEEEYSTHKDALDAAMHKIASSAEFILGKDLMQFEQSFARFCGVPFCCGVKSGTAALQLALLKLISPGDEVMVPAMTFVASAEAVVLAGGRPVFVDVDAQTFVVTRRTLEEAYTPNTKAVVVVHLHGNMPDMREVTDFCQKHKLALIEDCAQAHGANFEGKIAGTFGRAGCYSFFPAKILGGFGDGGAIITADEKLHASFGSLRNHGRVSKYVSDTVGFNERLDNFQAAILNVKLPYLSEWIAKRRRIASIYDDHFDDAGIIRQKITPGVQSPYYVYSIIVDNRDALAARLKEKGICTGIYYPVPIHEQEPYRSGKLLPGCKHVAAKVLSIPMHPYLSDDDAIRIARAVVEAEHEIRTDRIRSNQ